jgi:hypothetical protein
MLKPFISFIDFLKLNENKSNIVEMLIQMLTIIEFVHNSGHILGDI